MTFRQATCYIYIAKGDRLKHIVSFSGGKDSTAMLLLMIEKKMPIDEIIFCDTGKEFPAMYDHILEVEKYIGRKITILKPEKSFEYWLGEHIKTKGKNKGKIGYGWADFQNRWCTGHLKQNIISRHLKTQKTRKEYIGIAYDEKHRTNNNKGKKNLFYPLVEWEVTEKMALEYCYSKGFRWDGLYEKFSRVSCYCCPLQPLSELYTLYNEFPELWADMREMDKMSYRQFRSDYSIADLERKFKGKQKQKLFDFAI